MRNLFMTKPSRDWTLASFYSRRDFCRGLYQLYDLRDQLPIVSAHFLQQTAQAPVRVTPVAPRLDLSGHQRNDKYSDYTLYIPEDYSPDKPLPLILVALHGGYGQGAEYVWTWLRPARSRGSPSWHRSRSGIPGT